MKNLLILLILVITASLYAQENPVTISKKADNGKVTLIATNNADQSYILVLTIESQGLNIPSPKVVKKKIAALTSIDMITLIPQPGANASYSYHLEIQSEGEKETLYSRKTTSGTLIGNSSRLRSEQAHKNVEANINKEATTLFTKENCDRCDWVKAYFTDQGIKYTEINISESSHNDLLMWDALHVYGEKEGRITLPVLIYSGKIYHSLDHPEKEIPAILQM